MLQIAAKSVNSGLMAKAAVHTVSFLLRLSPSLCERIDDWRREQADIPSRNEAIRRLLEQALGCAA